MVEFTSSLPLGTSNTPFTPSQVNPNEPYWKLINTHESFKVYKSHLLTSFFLDYMLRQQHILPTETIG